MADTTIPLDLVERAAMEAVCGAVAEAERSLEARQERAVAVCAAVAKRYCPNAPDGPFRIIARKDGSGIEAIAFATPAPAGAEALPVPEKVAEANHA